MDFKRTIYEDIIVEEVLLNRATSKEAEDFKSRISKDIDSGTRKLIVDLSRCEFIDSTFTGSIVVSLRKVSALGGDLRLVGLNPGVVHMFELTRVIRQFDVFPALETAIQSYGGQGATGLRNSRLILK